MEIMVQSWSPNPRQPLLNTLLEAHPRRVFSFSYLLTGFFHCGNTSSISSRHIEDPRDSAAWRHCPLGQRCGFDKGSISVSEGVLGGSGSHPRPLLSISYGP